jgi:hypothetical protein
MTPTLNALVVEADLKKEKYKYWDILNEIPIGWSIDKTAGSPAPNTVFITNGKSVLSGEQKRSLLRVFKQEMPPMQFTAPPREKEIEIEQDYFFPARTVNELARKKFQASLLKDIIFDLKVCEIEGWDKKEYINEIKNLVNSIIFEVD